MIRAVSYVLSILIHLSLVLFAVDIFGQTITFDCPGTAKARVIAVSASQKIVEVPFSVSSAFADSSQNVEQLKIQVDWNRSAYPVVDYGPRTELHSRYEGPVSVEKRVENNAGVGAKVSSSAIDFLTPSLNADLGHRNSETRRFNEIPQHEVQLASGTTNRGTGVFFEFHDSPISTLEGSRELVIAFEVPESWRGGVLQVTFRATGQQKKFGSFDNAFEFARIFVMPVYLEGDNQARQLAYEFARSEVQLRRDWSLHESKISKGSNQWQKWFGSDRYRNELPNMWVHHLIQSSSDVSIERFRRKLPEPVADAASQFVEARRNLVALSR